MASTRDDNLFPRAPGEIPNCMAIRDADIQRRKDNEVRLRVLRLARDVPQVAKLKRAVPARLPPIYIAAINVEGQTLYRNLRDKRRKLAKDERVRGGARPETPALVAAVLPWSR